MFRPTNISTVEQIQAYLTEMQSYSEAHYNADNIQAVIDRAISLEAYMAHSGKLLADAQYHYNDVVGSSIMEALGKALETKLSAMTLNKYVEAAAKDYKYLVTWAERVNKSCTHQLDMARTIISKHKAEMQHVR